MNCGYAACVRDEATEAGKLGDDCLAERALAE
jgi:hypothetical protein